MESLVNHNQQIAKNGREEILLDTDIDKVEMKLNDYFLLVQKGVAEFNSEKLAFELEQTQFAEIKGILCKRLVENELSDKRLDEFTVKIETNRAELQEQRRMLNEERRRHSKKILEKKVLEEATSKARQEKASISTDHQNVLRHELEQKMKMKLNNLEITLKGSDNRGDFYMRRMSAFDLWKADVEDELASLTSRETSFVEQFASKRPPYLSSTYSFSSSRLSINASVVRLSGPSNPLPDRQSKHQNIGAIDNFNVQFQSIDIHGIATAISVSEVELKSSHKELIEEQKTSQEEVKSEVHPSLHHSTSHTKESDQGTKDSSLNDVSTAAAAAHSYRKGDSAENYSEEDKEWYSCEVLAVNSDGTYRILENDIEEKLVTSGALRRPMSTQPSTPPHVEVQVSQKQSRKDTVRPSPQSRSVSVSVALEHYFSNSTPSKVVDGSSLRWDLQPFHWTTVMSANQFEHGTVRVCVHEHEHASTKVIAEGSASLGVLRPGGVGRKGNPPSGTVGEGEGEDEVYSSDSVSEAKVSGKNAHDLICDLKSPNGTKFGSVSIRCVVTPIDVPVVPTDKTSTNTTRVREYNLPELDRWKRNVKNHLQAIASDCRGVEVYVLSEVEAAARSLEAQRVELRLDAEGKIMNKRKELSAKRKTAVDELRAKTAEKKREIALLEKNHQHLVREQEELVVRKQSVRSRLVSVSAAARAARSAELTLLKLIEGHCEEWKRFFDDVRFALKEKYSGALLGFSRRSREVESSVPNRLIQSVINEMELMHVSMYPSPPFLAGTGVTARPPKLPADCNLRDAREASGAVDDSVISGSTMRIEEEHNLADSSFLVNASRAVPDDSFVGLGNLLSFESSSFANRYLPSSPMYIPDML